MSEVKKSDFMQKIRLIWRNFCQFVREFWDFIKKTYQGCMRSLVRWSDPKLDKYRVPANRIFSARGGKNDKTSYSEPQKSPNTNDFPPISDGGTLHPDSEQVITEVAQKTATGAADSPSQKNLDQSAEQAKNRSQSHSEAIQTNSFDFPTSRNEFFDLLHNIPISVFSQSERQLLDSILTLNSTSIEALMLPASKIVYVDKDEVLGPLTLDRLFHSGMEHFPVTSGKKKEIIGCIHTTRLNNLDIKQTSTAEELLDPTIYYARMDYTLSQALDTFLRNQAHFLLIVDKYGKIVGILNFADLCKHIFGDLKIDDFINDSERLSVAKRRFAIDIEKKRK